MARCSYIATGTQFPSANFIGQTGNDFRGNGELRMYSSTAPARFPLLADIRLLVERRASPPGWTRETPPSTVSRIMRPRYEPPNRGRGRVNCGGKKAGADGCPGPS